MNATDMQFDQILVHSVSDDFPLPMTGEVVGWPDEDTCLVVWPGSDVPREEPMDELTPVRPRTELS